MVLATHFGIEFRVVLGSRNFFFLYIFIHLTQHDHIFIRLNGKTSGAVYVLWMTGKLSVPEMELHVAWRTDATGCGAQRWATVDSVKDTISIFLLSSFFFASAAIIHCARLRKFRLVPAEMNQTYSHHIPSRLWTEQICFIAAQTLIGMKDKLKCCVLHATFISSEWLWLPIKSPMQTQ